MWGIIRSRGKHWYREDSAGPLFFLLYYLLWNRNILNNWRANYAILHRSEKKRKVGAMPWRAERGHSRWLSGLMLDLVHSQRPRCPGGLCKRHDSEWRIIKSQHRCSTTRGTVGPRTNTLNEHRASRYWTPTRDRPFHTAQSHLRTLRVTAYSTLQR